jgi:hypothetical protein
MYDFEKRKFAIPMANLIHSRSRLGKWHVNTAKGCHPGSISISGVAVSVFCSDCETRPLGTVGLTDLAMSMG